MGTTDAERTGLLMQALSNQFGMLQRFYGEIDSAHAGLFRLRWQQFLSSAATVAIVNSVGAGAAHLIAVGFLRHQWSIWMHVAKALPMME